MGMLISGNWSHEDRFIDNGRYEREDSLYGDVIDGATIEFIASMPGRFHLIASMSCQWSHRTMIVRSLKGLTELIPLHIAHGKRVEGYAVNGGDAWRVPGTDEDICHLHQLYTLDDPHYTGRVTVPVLWDGDRQRIISNESAHMMRAFDAIAATEIMQDFTLTPPDLIQQIEMLNQHIYEGLGNGVYRAGFAQNQSAYDEAVTQVFATLEELENRLGTQRFLFGNVITDADWRLFVTLVRFDCVYFVLHRCCKRRLTDYPHLWAYARDLYGWTGIDETVDFEAMRTAGYTNDTENNPHKIVALAPEVDWSAQHGREALGPAQVARRDGERVLIDTVTLRLRAA